MDETADGQHKGNAMNINAKCLGYVLDRLPTPNDVKGDILRMPLPDRLLPVPTWKVATSPQELREFKILTFRKVKIDDGQGSWYEWELCV